MTMKHRWLIPLLCLPWLSGLFGCSSVIKGEGSPATHYYLLSATADKNTTATPLRQDIRLALEPVEIPDYLARPQIVHREGDHRLVVEELDLWAEDLDAGLARVMAENFATLLNSDFVWRLPTKKSMHPDFRLGVQFLRFEVDSAGRALLSAHWKLRSRENVLAEEITEIRGDKREMGDKNAQVAALSTVLETFCRKISSKILSVHQDNDRHESENWKGSAKIPEITPTSLPKTSPKMKP